MPADALAVARQTLAATLASPRISDFGNPAPWLAMNDIGLCYRDLGHLAEAVHQFEAAAHWSTTVPAHQRPELADLPTGRSGHAEMAPPPRLAE